MNIQDIDKIYCITLYEVEDRFENSKKLKEIFNTDKFVFKYVIKHKFFNNIYKQLNFDLPGQLGCAISHYEVINEAYYLGHNYIMVCEDDLYIDNLNQLNLFLENTPKKFDILQVFALDNYFPDNNIVTKDDLQKEYDNGIYWKKVTKDCIRWGAMLYILSRNGMKYYLDSQNKNFCIADMPFINSYKNDNINHYIPTLTLTYQNGIKSQILE